MFTAQKPNEGENAIHYSEDMTYMGNVDIYALDLDTGQVIRIAYTEQDEIAPKRTKWGLEGRSGVCFPV